MENHHVGVTAERKQDCVLTSYGEASEAPFGLERLSLSNGGLGRENDRVQDETVLVSLDLSDHLGLILRGTIMVDDTQTAQKSHVNSHVVLSDSVHGRGEKGNLQRDTLGDGGIKDDIGSRESCHNHEQTALFRKG